MPCEQVFKIQEGRPNPADLMKNGEITLVMMTSGGDEADLRDGKELRRLALQVRAGCCLVMGRIALPWAGALFGTSAEG